MGENDAAADLTDRFFLWLYDFVAGVFAYLDWWSDAS